MGPRPLHWGRLVSPGELLDKLPTLRPGDMARLRYSPGGRLPTPPNPTDKENDHE